MFDPFQSAPTFSLRKTINKDSQHDHTIYYSTSSDSDSASAERRPVKSSTSGVGKYTPPHRKSGAASPSSEAGTKPAIDFSSVSSPVFATDPSPSAVTEERSPVVTLPSGTDETLPQAPTPAFPAPSSPATSNSSSTLTSKHSDKQCYVYIRTGHCAKGLLCRYKHETSAPPTNTVKHFDPKSHPSYRTKPCYPFIYGQCLKGDDCTFKHEIPAQQVLTSMSPTSEQSGSGALLSPEYRTKECKWFNSPGGCWYGDSCKFKHTIQPVQTSPSEPQQQPVDGNVPNSGTPTPTPKGEGDNLHPFYRTRPCPLFLRGTCQKGNLCNYIHPVLPNQEPPSPGAIPPIVPDALLAPHSISSTHHASDLGVTFVTPFPPRHAFTVPVPAQQKVPHHTYSLPPYSTSTINTSLDIPTTPVMTASTSPSTSISASPTSSLVASPPQSFFHRMSDNDVQDEETDAVIGGGMRFGAIGTGIPSFTKEPMTMVHEIYTYDDDDDNDDDDQVVYMPSRVSPISH